MVLGATCALGQNTFTNPLLPSGPDPWVEYHDGMYYYMNSTPKNLTLWKTRNMADLKSAPKKVVWNPPATGPYSHDIWAPEIHFLQGKWYIYFRRRRRKTTVASHLGDRKLLGRPIRRRMDFQGQVSDASDKWAIDASVFEDRGKLYYDLVGMGRRRKRHPEHIHRAYEKSVDRGERRVHGFPSRNIRGKKWAISDGIEDETIRLT